jgi:DNA-binding IclR family transcriptional regulator
MSTARPRTTASPPTGRALAVIDLLAADPEREHSLAQIVAALGVSKATCHAIVTTMVERGYLVRSPRSKGYTLGPAVIAAGSAAERANPAVHAARVAVPALARELGVECVASVLDPEFIVVVEWAPPPAAPSAADGRRGRPRAAWSHAGQRIPLVPPFGAVQMAWAEEASVDRWIARAPAAATGDLRRGLATIRARGFDVQRENVGLDRFRAALGELDLDQLSERSRAAVGQVIAELGPADEVPERLDPRARYDVNALAAPVFDADGRPVLTLSVHPSGEQSGAQVTAMGRRLRAAADELTAASGGRVPTAA